MASRVSGRARGVGRVEGELDDAAVAGGDVGFAADEGAVVHARRPGGVGGGGGVDAAAGGENLGGELDGLGEVAGDLSEGGDEEVAEVVALEGVAGAEAVIEELGQQVFFFAEGDHAVAQVAGREHVEVFAQAAGGAAVVGDGDDGGQVGDLDGGAGRAGDSDVAAQAAQQRGEAGAAADGDHAQGTRVRLGRRSEESSRWTRIQWSGLETAQRFTSMALRNLRIQQLGEAGIVHHALKVVVRRGPGGGFWD